MRRLLSALIDPPEAMRRGVLEARPLRTAAALASAVTALGLATLPRQVAILNRVLASTGDPQSNLHHEALRSALLRLIVADRLVPAPALLLAAVFLVAVAEPVLMLARDRRAAIVQIALLGLAPLLVDRLGELAMTYLVPLADQVTAGRAPVTIPDGQDNVRAMGETLMTTYVIAVEMAGKVSEDLVQGVQRPVVDLDGSDLPLVEEEGRKHIAAAAWTDN